MSRVHGEMIFLAAIILFQCFSCSWAFTCDTNSQCPDGFHCCPGTIWCCSDGYLCTGTSTCLGIWLIVVVTILVILVISALSVKLFLHCSAKKDTTATMEYKEGEESTCFTVHDSNHA